MLTRSYTYLRILKVSITILLGLCTVYGFYMWLVITPSAAAAGNITGTAFRDFNADGLRSVGNVEPAIAGVVVTVFDGEDDFCTTATAADGSYTVDTAACISNNADGLIAGPYRVEFTLTPTMSAYLEPGAAGGSTVQFVNDGGGTADISYNNPAQYCQDSPELTTPCYVNGDPLANDTAGNLDVVVSFVYTSSGDTVPPNHLSFGSEMGAVYGLAYQRSTETLFASALMKRHAGLGQLGPGGIYQIDVSGAPIVTDFVDLQTIGVNSGLDVHVGLSGVATDPSHDPAAFDAVGKSLFGDMDISEDEQTLWLTNLFSRTLVQVDIGLPAQVPTAADVTEYAIPDPGCSNGEFRPWALDIQDGFVYVGIVCSAETSQAVGDLEAHILSFNPDDLTFTSIFVMDLDYPRGYVSVQGVNQPDADWRPWIDEWTDINTPAPGAGPYAQTMYPQPILSDIEFDNDGSMILGFVDRFGHQAGNENYSTDTLDTATYEATGAGDIIRVCNDNGTFVLENNAQCPGGAATNGANGADGGQGPGGGEFYWQDMYTLDAAQDAGTHNEIALGGLMMIPGKSEVVSVIFDPVNDFRAAGVGWFNNNDGTRGQSYEIFGQDANGQPATFGKAAGLGDLEAFCNAAPVEVGNRVWTDTDNDGLQDANETGINGVDVTLTCGIDSVTVATAGNGDYLFSSATNAPFMDAGESCTISIDTTQAAISGGSLNLTSTDTDGETTNDNETDLRDSDGVMNGTNAEVNFTVGAAGHNNHTFDFGFTTAAFDWGDDPDSYNTQASSGGASHQINGTNYLGSCVDAETTGSSSVGSDGDDGTVSTLVFGTCIGNDDEDGVTFTGNWSDGTGEISVDVTGGDACLNMWVDFTDGAAVLANGDGDFNDTHPGPFPEHVIQNQPVTTGNSNHSFNLPAGAANSASWYVRTRLTPRDTGGVCTGADTYAAAVPTSSGLALGGEVEDYQTSFTPTAVSFRNASANQEPISLVLIMTLLLFSMGTILMLYRHHKLT